MSLDVGELVARLTVDDTRFTRATQQAEQRLQNLGTTARTEAGRVDQALQNAGQGAGRLGQNAQDAARDLSRVGNTTRDISRVDTTARQAATGVQEIGNSAREAGRQVGQLGNELDNAASGAGDSGARSGGNFLSGFSDAIGELGSKTGPVAGSILGIAALGLAAGAALAAAIQDGMQTELDRDIFQAQTGTTDAQARKFATAAGESFADAFGESVNANLGTTKIALQNGLLDPGSTQRDAEQMINSLSGVSDILGEEIPAVAAAAGHAIKTGFAYDAQDAFDLIVKGSQMGLNVSEDWLDTINEYGIQFQKLGISGADSIGLMSQALKGGARDTDIAADALKEFSIRAMDGSEGSAEAFQAIGLNAEEMTQKISEGGEGAREGLQQVLEGIQKMEPGVERTTALVGLFGTQSEDLGDALLNMNLDTATAAMNDYEGAAQRAINIMGGNAATSVQGAMNSISVAGDGLKAALAEAFGPYIQQFADQISNNRAGVIQFFIDVGNAGFEGAKAVLGFVETGMRGLAEFAQAGTDMSVSFLRSLADMTEGISSISSVLSLVIPGFGSAFGDMGDISGKLNGMADAAEKVGNGVADGLNKGADGVHSLIADGGILDQAQTKFNEVAGKMQESAAFNDASTKLGKAIGEIGVGADGASIKIDNWTGAIDRNNAAQVQMENGIKGLKDGLEEQIRTGLEAGVTVEGLTQQYDENRAALIDQLMATGMNNKEALAYINTLGLTPELVETLIRQPGMPEAHSALDILKGKVLDVPDEKTVHTEALTKDAEDALTNLGYTVEHLPDGTVKVTAPTDAAEHELQTWLQRERNIKVGVYPTIMEARTAQGVPADFQGPVNYLNPTANADGGIHEPGQANIRQGQGRGIYQWAEAETDWEAFIPGAPSKRKQSEKILAETAKRFGLGLVKPMADGGITGGFDGKAATAYAKSHAGEPYVYGGLDCSGFLSGVFNAGTGQSVRFVTGSDFASMGWAPGYDPNGFSIGTNGGVGENGHMAGSLYGTNIESDGSNGIQYGGGADGALDFPEVWHWPGAGGGNDPSTEDVNNAVKNGLGELGPGAATGTTGSGSTTISTDGQRVFVTNWPGSSSSTGTGTSTGTAPAPAGDAKTEDIFRAQFKIRANGGIDNLPNQAGIQHGTVYQYGEPGTGGEGFIPLAPSKRGRSVQITKQIANRFGYELVPMENGGLGGFGGYTDGGDRPTLDIPLTAGGLAGMTANQRRAALYNLGAIGVGGAFAVASGWDENGQFTGQFDTGANSHPALEKGVGQITELLDQIRKAAEEGKTVNVKVDVDQSGNANLAITKMGL